ncbi:MAG: BatD family protein [Muribaculaceae bacterium]|nr:BatD family protein [Muribaculaceae bacterium]
MRTLHNRLLLLILLTLTCVGAMAQVSFTVSAPQKVSVGEKFAVTYRVKNGEGSGLKVPQINGCTQIFGPAVSSSSSFSVINGHTEKRSVIDYTYTYRADKEGTYTIGEASVTVDGKRMTTRPVSITIGPAKAGSSAQPDDPRASRQGAVDMEDISTQSADRSVSSSDVFVRIILSKPTAYEQEAIECTIKLYTKYSISSFFPTRQPSFDGFLIEEMNLQPSLNQVEVYNGQKYMTALLKKCIIFPQKSGKLTINSGNYDIDVVQYDNVNMGLFSVQTPQERKIKVSSNSASIDIRPLPQPQPEGFTGAVGTFSIDSRMLGSSYRTNDPATLIYTISGTGNIKYIKEPVIDFPSEFEQYTPKADIDARVSGNNVTGKMTIEYTFVPQAVGDFTIGSDKFVYFDINEKRYVTLTTPSYNIKVAKGASQSTTTRKDVELKNTDILHIYTGDKAASKEHTLVIAQWWYWMIYVLLICGVIAVLAVNRRNIRRSADIKGMKLARASKVARKRLKLAKEYMTGKQNEKFYEEMLRAVWGYLSDKLSIPASQLSRDNVAAELTSYGATEDTVNDMIDVLDECEMARYTPSATPEQAERIYDKASQAINALENVKRQK